MDPRIDLVARTPEIPAWSLAGQCLLIVERSKIYAGNARPSSSIIAHVHFKIRKARDNYDYHKVLFFYPTLDDKLHHCACGV